MHTLIRKIREFSVWGVLIFDRGQFSVAPVWLKLFLEEPSQRPPSPLTNLRSSCVEAEPPLASLPCKVQPAK